jgi:hypothetical protein
MEHSIFKIQSEKEAEIKEILDKHRNTEAWEKSRKAFHEIIRAYVHGDMKSMSDAELDQHFERALVTTKDDVNAHLSSSTVDPESEQDVSSPYYMVNVAHTRNDNFFATNQSCPVTGTGKQKLNAKFDAKNLYQKYPINAASLMPPRVDNTSFSSWDSIVDAMTNRATFDQTFSLTDPIQANEIFEATSVLDWNTAQGELFMTPTLFGGAVFSPALYSLYFFRSSQSSPINIFFFVTADGQGNPEKPFVGLVNKVSEPKKKVYDSINRFSFTYISNKENPTRYWLNMNDDNLLNFNLGMQLFYPTHPDLPYIEVNACFSAQAPMKDVAYFKDVPGLSTILLVQKGTLMRDLIKAYFPDSHLGKLWIEVGALTNGHEWEEDLLAIGLNTMSDLFASNVWQEKPTVI